DGHRRQPLLGKKQEILHVARDVAGLAVDDDLIAAAAGERVGQCPARIKLVALLVESDHLQVRSKPYGAAVRLKLARQHLQERRLAGAVGTDDADAVLTKDAGRQTVDNGNTAERFRDAVRLDD